MAGAMRRGVAGAGGTRRVRPGHRAARLAVAAVAVAALAGCASTEELYAEYDAALCPIVAVPSGQGATREVRYVERATGEAVPFPPAIYFGYDSDALDGWARLELDVAAAVLNRYPELNLLTTGFTSELGSREYNVRLAARRTARVVQYLRDAGVARGRMLAQPVGKGLPRFTNDERVANAVNRRVGLTLLDRAGRPVHPGFEEPTLERGRERVGPDWPPNGVPANLRARRPVGTGRDPRLAPVPGLGAAGATGAVGAARATGATGPARSVPGAFPGGAPPAGSGSGGDVR